MIQPHPLAIFFLGEKIGYIWTSVLVGFVQNEGEIWKNLKHNLGKIN